MGSVNKQSVREEADQIKAEFDRLCLNNKINSEIKLLFQSMIMLIIAETYLFRPERASMILFGKA